MTTSLSGLLGPLSEVGLDLDIEGARDAVWLALRIGERDPQPTTSADAAADSKAPPAGTGAAETALERAREAAKGTPPKVETERERVATAGAGTSGAGKALRGVRLPVAAALPEARGIARGLRPLRRRVPSTGIADLDVDATVRRAAEEEIWLPVMRARPERWLDLTLVIDDTRSMVIWHEVIDELRHVFQWSGAFRRIDTWWARGENGPVLFRDSRRAARDKRQRHGASLTAVPHRGLVLVVTDCVADAWYDGSFAAQLAEWAHAAPVGIVQVLPTRFWGRTALSLATPVHVRAPAVGAVNAHLMGEERHALVDADDTSHATKTFVAPIATIDPRSLGQLARLVAGPATEPTSGFLFDIAAMRDLGPPRPRRAMDAHERVRRFWSVASAAAKRLASAFAASPFLSLRVLRLLRRELIPGSSHLPEAEVMLGGIVERVHDDGAGDGDIALRFAEGVRPLLLDNVSTDDALRVLRKAAELAADDQPDAHRFLAVLDDPSSLATPLTPAEGTFAQAVAGSLAWIGGPYARLVSAGPPAETLQPATAAQAAERQEAQAAPDSGSAVSRAERGHWFYVSHSGREDKKYLGAFVQDLGESVALRLGVPLDHIAFFNTDPVHAPDGWLSAELQGSRVLVAICSPQYFHSEFCGREWDLFRRRQRALAERGGAANAPVILPVLWEAGGMSEGWIPAAAQDVLYVAPESIGRKHSDRGVRELLKSRSKAYKTLVEQLASRIVEVGQRYVVPPLRDDELGLLENPFAVSNEDVQKTSLRPVEEIFDEIRRRLERDKSLAKSGGTYKFVITTGASNDRYSWLVDLERGRLVEPGYEGDAKCTVTMTADDFVALARGQLPMQTAFMAGRMKIAGELGLAYSVNRLFSDAPPGKDDGIFVTTTTVNVRAGPGVDHPRVNDPLPRGTRVRVLAAKGGWRSVQVATGEPAGGTQGWVLERYLQTADDGVLEGKVGGRVPPSGDPSYMLDRVEGTPAVRSLADDDFVRAARTLSTEVAVVRAVVDVEGASNGFLKDGRPTLLFESRWFHKLTHGRYDAAYPHISTAKWVRNYARGEAEYGRLGLAASLDYEAALKSATWGRFQLLGQNFRSAGYDGVEKFVLAQFESEGKQLDTVVDFIIASKLHDKLRKKRWGDFAKRYNGPGPSTSLYAKKLADAYARYAGSSSTPAGQNRSRAKKKKRSLRKR